MTKTEQAISKAIEFARDMTTKDYCYKWYDQPDHLCPICHPETPLQGFNCINFVCACYGHGAGDMKMLKNCARLGGRGFGGDTMLTHVTSLLWKIHNGFNWQMIGSGFKGAPSMDSSLLLPGDILLGYDDTGRYKHSMLYVGNNNIIDCKPEDDGSRDIDVVTYEKRTKEYRITRAFRYTGKGNL